MEVEGREGGGGGGGGDGREGRPGIIRRGAPTYASASRPSSPRTHHTHTAAHLREAVQGPRQVWRRHLEMVVGHLLLQGMRGVYT